jgi:hypothetical protein
MKADRDRKWLIAKREQGRKRIIELKEEIGKGREEFEQRKELFRAKIQQKLEMAATCNIIQKALDAKILLYLRRDQIRVGKLKKQEGIKKRLDKYVK